MSVDEVASGDDIQPVTGILVVGATDRVTPYLTGLPTEPLAHLAGIYDPSPERARDTARRSGDVPHSSDLEEALSWPGVDACIVGAPADYPGELGETLAEARKHVLMVEPPSGSVEDARRLQDRFATMDLAIMAATPNRYSDYATTVRAEADRGHLGRIVFVRLALLGVPAIGESIFDLVTWWMEEQPSSVYALQPGNSPGYLSVTLTFAGGATAICELECTEGGGVRHFRHVYVLGTEGALELPWNESPNLVIDTTGSVDYPRGGNQHRRQLRAWLTQVRDRRRPGSSIEEQTRVLAIEAATHRSLECGDVVPLDSHLTVEGAGR